MKKLVSTLLIGIIGVAINCFSLLVGWWLATVLVGLLIGLAIRRFSMAFLIASCIGGLSWGLPLAVLAKNAPVGLIAVAVENTIGLSATNGAAIIIFTVVLGCLLSMVGTWIGGCCWRLPSRVALIRSAVLPRSQIHNGSHEKELTSSS